LRITPRKYEYNKGSENYFTHLVDPETNNWNFTPKADSASHKDKAGSSPPGNPGGNFLAGAAPVAFRSIYQHWHREAIIGAMSISNFYHGSAMICFI
jgi:hypothetical protein